MKNGMTNVCLIDVWKDENDADDAVYSKKEKKYLTCCSPFTPPENVRLKKRKSLIKNMPLMHCQNILQLNNKLNTTSLPKHFKHLMSISGLIVYIRF